MKCTILPKIILRGGRVEADSGEKGGVGEQAEQELITKAGGVGNDSF